MTSRTCIIGKIRLATLIARTPLWNIWGYNTTQGLGFYEYLQLCEDLGAEPLFCINCGMSLMAAVPLDANGPVDSGRARRD